jgi:hypothetical protein
MTKAREINISGETVTQVTYKEINFGFLKYLDYIFSPSILANELIIKYNYTILNCRENFIDLQHN